MALALAAIVFRGSQWRVGMPDLNAVAVAALLLVPLAVRLQITISRGTTDLTLGTSAAALFASDVDRLSTTLPIWAVLVAVSYAFFHRDDTHGQFRAAIQVLGGAALVRAAQFTDIGYTPYDRVFTGLTAYFAVITLLEVVRRMLAPPSPDGVGLHLRWTWTFLMGLAVYYVGAGLAVLRRIEAGIPLPLVPSLVVVLVGLAAVVAGLTLRGRELSRSVAALSRAAVAMPWGRDEIDTSLSRWGAAAVRVEHVDVRDVPGSRSDVSVPLSDGRYVVAERSPGDLPFTQVEMDVLGALANLAERSRSEATQVDELRERANIDALTGLPTYTYFRELLAEAITSRREGDSVAVAFIDLDGFKEINDRYGHVAGDVAIRTVAERLVAHVGDRLRLTRHGGDEFAVLLTDVGDYAGLAREVERLRALVAEPVVVEQNTLRLRATIGSALSTSPEDALEQLVRAADQQMTQRKRAVHAADGPVTSRIDEAVRQAITTGSLTTAYQPIVNLQVDEVRGFEALVRYADPQVGSIPPPTIVESAIRLNLLDDMTMQVLEQSIATMEACREHVPHLLVFTINLELEQLSTWTPLLQRLSECQAEHAMTVVVEISERSIGDWSEANADVTYRLQESGVLIAIDDFGAGFSSLGSLHLPRVDVVKLDRSLLTDLSDPRQTLVVTRATQLLIELGFWVIAEGATEEDEVPVLRDAGATHVQGYLFGMPLDRASLVERFRLHGVEPLLRPTSS